MTCAACNERTCSHPDPIYQGVILSKQSHELTEYLDGFGIALPGTAHRSILPETPGHGGGVHSASAALSGEVA